MGWREFTKYVEVMNKQVEAARAEADSWENAEVDPVWHELRAKRDRARGRG